MPLSLARRIIQDGEGTPAGHRSSPWVGYAGTAVLLAIISFPYLRALFSSFAGGFHDDGIYLVTARALAEGHGYTINSLPQPLPQTKYPILLPGLIAVLWRVWPDFPGNLPLLRAVPFVALWLWLWLVWKVVAQELGRRELATWIVLLVACSPTTLFFGTTLLSETLFAALATWSALLMIRMVKAGRAPSRGDAILLALSCALAFYSRTIAVTLLPAGAFVFMRLKAPAAAGWFGAASLLSYSPWLLWQQLQDVPSDPALTYYTAASYSSWNLVTGSATAIWEPVFWRNLIWMLSIPPGFWDVPRSMWNTGLVLLIGAMCVIGVIRLMWRSTAPVAIWLAATVVISLLWVWPPYRFIVPVMPFIILGFAELFERLAPALGKPLGRVAAMALLVSGLTSAWLYEWPASRGSREPVHQNERTEILESVDWVRRSTPQNAILAAGMDPVYWLYADRKAIRAFDVDPYRLFYSASAPIGSVGSEFALLRRLGEYRVNYLVVENFDVYAETPAVAEQLARFRKRWPSLLRLEWTSSGGTVRLFRVNLTAADYELQNRAREGISGRPAS